MPAGAASSVTTAVRSPSPAERRERGPAPLRVVDEADHLRRRLDHQALDLRLLLGRIAEARFDREPSRSHERLLDVDLPEQAVTQRADEAERLPAYEARRHRDRDARDARELRAMRSPLVMTVRWSQLPRA